MTDLDAAAAVAEALRIFRAARRPRCWRCRELMARDTSGDFWHCTIASCPGSLLSTDRELPWEPPC